MSEEALLFAVADYLKKSIVPQTECTVEYMDDFVPSAVAHQYIAVLPAGLTAGPQGDGGYVLDENVQVEVVLYKRSTHIPRDRQREAFRTNYGGINKVTRQIIEAVHFNEQIRLAANAEISDTDESYIKPLHWLGATRPRSVSAEVFGSVQNEPRAGMKRVIAFGGAYRIQTQTNLL